MKKFYHISLFFLVYIAISGQVAGQSQPVWTHDITASPDTAYLYPVRTGHDGNNHVFVLSTFSKSIGPGVFQNKIFLKKYDYTGSLLWTLIFDSAGTGNPRGFDMAVDNAGNCFIAGGFMASPNYRPLLMKVNPTGSIVWQRDSTTTFNTNYFDQLILKNNLLYLKSPSGIATFDLNGNEIWSHNLGAEHIAIDNSGRMIVSAYTSGFQNIFRYDVSGNFDFSDSSILGKRIAVDQDNSFYLLEDYPASGYALVKYDSSGTFQWSKNSFPAANGFGDISFDVLVDYNNDVIVTGLADTMFKFTSSGNLVWEKPMNGLDSYITVAQITFSNILVIAGSMPDSTGYHMALATFNLFGNQNAYGLYNGNPLSQEFVVDMTIDGSWFYVVETNDDHVTLAKFDFGFGSAPIDFSLICVDSVWYDPVLPNYVHTRVYNGNLNSLNYPTVGAVSSTGDTIINPNHSFFAHLPNSYQTYFDTITVTGITDFRNYTFFISDAFPDTMAAIGWCTPASVPEWAGGEFLIYPNPVHTELLIKTNRGNSDFIVEVFSYSGSKVMEEKYSAGPLTRVDVSSFANGLYFLRLRDGSHMKHFRFIKQ